MSHWWIHVAALAATVDLLQNMAALIEHRGGHDRLPVEVGTVCVMFGIRDDDPPPVGLALAAEGRGSRPSPRPGSPSAHCSRPSAPHSRRARRSGGG